MHFGGLFVEGDNFVDQILYNIMDFQHKFKI